MKNRPEAERTLDEWVAGFLQKFPLPLQDAKDSPVACAVLLSVLTFLFLVPFVGKAYHIDDPLFLWAAQHIHVSPLDPYGFSLNWYGSEAPMWDVMKNPPLVSYYLAAVALFFGWGEVAIHLALILPAVGVILGTYYAARLLRLQPIHAALTCLATPVFIVSGTNVMSDMLMLCFWVWSVGLWIKGLEGSRTALLAFSAFLIALSALTKYYGMALIPLLFVYSLVRKRSLGLWVLPLLLPLCVLAVYQWYTGTLYGPGLITEAAKYSAATRSEHFNEFVQLMIGTAFVGGCVISGLFCAPLVWRWKWLLGAGIFTLIVMVLLSGVETIGDVSLRDSDGIRWSLIVHFSIFLVAGISIFMLAVGDLWKHRDATSILFALWIGGTVVFSSLVNWSINARTLLPMVPAVAILLMRRMYSQDAPAALKRPIHACWALIAAAVLSLLVGYADFTLANSGKAAAIQIEERYGRNMQRVFFQGHWGFQYYMERHGARAVDAMKTDYRPGDIFVVPLNNISLIMMNVRSFLPAGKFSVQTLKYLATMNHYTSAAFYSDAYGILPYSFGPVPPEPYDLWSVK